VVVALAFVLRAGLPLAALAVARPQPPKIREDDSLGYIQVAEELVATGRFARLGRPEIARTPGYVLLLEPGVLLGHVDSVTIALQVAVGCLTVYLTYHLALLIFERHGVALAAAVLSACEPLSALYAGKLLSETAFTCAVTGLVFLFARYLLRAGCCNLIGSAVVLAVAIYIRPIALYLSVVLTVMLLAGHWRRTASRRRLGVQAAAFLAISAGLPAAWAVRNQAVAAYGRFSAMGDVNLYFWQAAGVEAATTGRKLVDVQREWGLFDADVFHQRHPEARDWSKPQRCAFYRQEAMRILREAPGTALTVHLAGIRSTLLDAGTQAFRDYFRIANPPAENPPPTDDNAWNRLRRAWVAKPLAVLLHGALQVLTVAYLALAMLGWLTSGHWRRPAVVLLVVTIGYLLLFSGGPAGYHRFRLPLVPLLSVLAAGGCRNCGWRIAD
jgi:4-amino-4-deoxy-L-arabinose transferase-like glycosyltransferase